MKPVEKRSRRQWGGWGKGHNERGGEKWWNGWGEDDDNNEAGGEIQKPSRRHTGYRAWPKNQKAQTHTDPTHEASVCCGFRFWDLLPLISKTWFSLLYPPVDEQIHGLSHNCSKKPALSSTFTFTESCVAQEASGLATTPMIFPT